MARYHDLPEGEHESDHDALNNNASDCEKLASHRVGCDGTRSAKGGSELEEGVAGWTKGCKRKDAASTPPPDISSPGSYVCHEF